MDRFWSVVAIVLALSPMAWAQLTFEIGDRSLLLSITATNEGVGESKVQIDGTPHALTGVGWRISTGNGEAVAGVATSTPDPAGTSPLTTATFGGTSEDFDWGLEYRVTGPGRITKYLTLVAKRDVVVERVNLWDVTVETVPRVQSTSLQDIAAFYRFEDAGLFVSLDFPYSKIATTDRRTRVTYPPFVSLRAGESYEAHSLTIGAVELTGKALYGPDAGEVGAMDAYMQARFEPRFNRPMYVYCGIVNRYTQPTDKIVWYSYNDHPSLTFHPDLLKSDMELMTHLGMEYYQMFPGPFDWVPGDPDPVVVRDVTDTARALGVRPGTYSTTEGLFCFHYNEHQNTLVRPEWNTMDEQNRPGSFCLGNPAYVDYHVEHLAQVCREYGFELNCFDSLVIKACWATTHGHPPGEDSVYHQVAGLVRLLQGINAVSPEMMTWSNAGNWGDFLPKLAWWNPNMYLTDPFIHTPWQGLNMTRLLDDARREQMVELHNTRFIPYRFLTNFQYFLHQNSVVPDLREYEFGVLSTLAVAPNLGLGEFRPWYDNLSPGNQQRVSSFYSKWTAFLNENYDLFTRTYEAGERPGLGGIEIYGHAEGNHGYIFVVNPNYWDQVVELPLDETLGFSGEDRSEIVERYPVERLRLTPEGTTVNLGTRLPVLARAREVLVLEVRPAPNTLSKPTLYRLPGTVERTESGLRVKTSGAQGTTARFAVALPPEAGSVVSASVLRDVPKQPVRDFFETGLKVLGRGNSCALFEVTFRRTPAPTELRDWRAASGTLDLGLSQNLQNGLPDGDLVQFPLFENLADAEVPSPVWGTTLKDLGFGPLARFCGGYIENAFQETQETWIDLQMGEGPLLPEVSISDGVALPQPHPVAEAARSLETAWWLATSFQLPFMYSVVSQPHTDEHTLLVLPLANPESVKTIRGWINGVPLDIRSYNYPRNPALRCFWADLVGTGARAGENALVLHIELTP